MSKSAILKTNRLNAEHYRWGDGCDGWHLLKRPGVSIIQERMPPGTSEVRHFHRESEQFFFVLAGSLVIDLDGELVMLDPGDGLHVPSGAVHQVINSSQEDVEFVVTSVPPSHNDRILVED